MEEVEIIKKKLVKHYGLIYMKIVLQYLLNKLQKILVMFMKDEYVSKIVSVRNI